MCVNPINIGAYVVPCGQCWECRKRKQNAYTLSISQEMKEWKNCYLITLTYDQEHLPLSNLQCLVDAYVARVAKKFEIKTQQKLGDYEKNRIEESIWSAIEHCKDSLLDGAALPSYILSANVDRASSNSQAFDNVVNYEYLVNPTPETDIPVLDRSSFSKFITDFRKHLTDEIIKSYGLKTSAAARKEHWARFAYAGCGEYGDMRSRPHYHFIIMSNEDDYIIEKSVNHSWTNGHIDFKKVEFGREGKFSAAAAYVAKYMWKPCEVDNLYCALGIVPPPFKLASHNLGMRYRTKVWFPQIQQYVNECKRRGCVYKDDIDNLYIYCDDFFKGLNELFYVWSDDMKFKYRVPQTWINKLFPHIKVERTRRCGPINEEEPSKTPYKKVIVNEKDSRSPLAMAFSEYSRRMYDNRIHERSIRFMQKGRLPSVARGMAANEIFEEHFAAYKKSLSRICKYYTEKSLLSKL